MVQRNPILDFVSHAILILGVAIVFFPIYVTFIGSTQTAEQISSANPISLVPGDNIVESYRFALLGGKTPVTSARRASPSLWEAPAWGWKRTMSTSWSGSPTVTQRKPSLATSLLTSRPRPSR